MCRRGSRGRCIIRHEYLLDNDDYIVNSMSKLKITNLSAFWMDEFYDIVDEDNHSFWKIFLDNLPLFDNCRDNIIAWMQVNENWTKRCTDENIEMYKQHGAAITMPLPINEANLVFNNPVVAIEIGLLEVVRFLIEKKGVDVNADHWSGFNSNGNDFNWHLVSVALARGDPGILQYILSVDRFDFDKMLRPNGGSVESLIINECLIELTVNDRAECLEIFLRHPKVNLNIAFRELLDVLSLCIVRKDEGMIKKYLKWIDVILDGVADPQVEVYGQSHMSYVREELREALDMSEVSMAKHWRWVLQKLESWRRGG